LALEANGYTRCATDPVYDPAVAFVLWMDEG
jgi:hypothetical protein